MTRYEYKVIPAPTKGKRGKGVKGVDGKFAFALENALNDLAAEGWEYQRADTLPSEERAGLTSKNTVFRTILIFRRPLSEPEAQAIEPPKQIEAPRPAPAPEPEAEAEPEPIPDLPEDSAEDDTRL